MKGKSNIGDMLLFVPLAAMWVVYLVLRDKLPKEIGSHFHVENGKWVADDHMAPIALMVVMTLAYVIVYASMSFRFASLKTNMTDKMMAGMRLFRGALLLLLSVITMHMLLGGVQGEVDSRTGTIIMIFLLVFTNAFVFFIFREVRKSGERMPLSPTYYNIIWAGLHLFISWIMINGMAASAGFNAMSGKGMHLFVFAFLAILGNMMYNIKPNFFIGIRTPWTLKNEEVWKRTHRFGSVAMFVAGLVAFIVLLASPDRSFEYLLPMVVVVGAIVPAIYSYIVYRQVTQTK